jgi:hypothetical protein
MRYESSRHSKMAALLDSNAEVETDPIRKIKAARTGGRVSNSGGTRRQAGGPTADDYSRNSGLTDKHGSAIHHVRRTQHDRHQARGLPTRHGRRPAWHRSAAAHFSDRIRDSGDQAGAAVISQPAATTVLSNIRFDGRIFQSRQSSPLHPKDELREQPFPRKAD